MERKFLAVLSVFALVVVIGIYLNPATNRVCFKEKCFEVELAVTDEQQVRGLSGRESLAAEKGMLFVFAKEGIYPFWMKDMKFALDMVWIAKNGTVVGIAADSQPCGAGPVCIPILPISNSSYVLEVNVGVANSTGLKLGDKVAIAVKR